MDTSRFAPSQDHPERKPLSQDRPARSQQYGYHVRIKAPDITGQGAEIYLDGIKLRGVRRYSVTVGDLAEANEVTITLIADSVNRDEATS